MRGEIEMGSGIESQITALIVSMFQVDPTMVRRNTTFATDLGADSLDCVVLIMAIEDAFDVEIHDEDAAEILTVGQMIEYVVFALATKMPAIARSNSGGAVGLR